MRSSVWRNMSVGALAVAGFMASAPTIASAQSLVIRGATVHTPTGPAPRATIVIEDGRIAAVGTSVATPGGAAVIDAAGLHVYPGFFDAFSQLGLTEMSDVAVTNDFTELGEFNPHLQSYRAVHPSTEHIPVTRVGGITHALTAPAAPAGGVGGQASVISLDGWTVEEMLVSPSAGFVVTWPAIAAGGARPFDEVKREYDEQIRRMAQWLEDARRYDEAVKARQDVTRDLKLEAFSKVTRRELPLLVRVDDERYIRQAVAFADDHKIRVVVVGGRQAWKAAQLLAEKHVPVVLGPTQALPSGPDERYDEQYAAPAILHKAGVPIAFGSFSSAYSRTLPFQAANAVPYGLPHEAAVRAITVTGAEILGLADRVGTIERGKLANLLITTGDPLEYQTEIRHVIIDGRDVGRANRHLELYERYRSRPRGK